MIRLVPDSRSVILQSTHIVLVRVTRVEAPAWSAERTRIARIELNLIEVLKGEIVNGSGTVRFEVTQRLPDPEGYPYPNNCWSSQDVQTGAELVIFSKTESRVAADVVGQSACRRLMLSSLALSSVRAAAQVEAENPPLDNLARRLVSVAGGIQPVFMEYLVERFGDLRLQERGNFEAVLALLEAPALQPVVRVTLWNGIRGFIMSSGRVEEWHFHRVAISLFRLLALPEAVSMQGNIIGTYLPNLLGLGTSNVRSANDVFRDWPGERQNATSVINGYSGADSKEPLLSWLKAR
ncbi:MAG: hypothetical protein LAP61_12825 [Acidobacteriia bacterium]|nr:hypothetical protein [Terriglobia bacterium]